MRDEKAGTNETNWRDDYDWQAAFEYAGGTVEGYGGYGQANVTAIGECATSSFGVHDVAEVYKMDEGENDGPPWIMWGLLLDGRHFFLNAGCDYTGWDCQAGGDAWVSAEKDRLVHAAMDIEARRRFGLPSEG